MANNKNNKNSKIKQQKTRRWVADKVIINKKTESLFKYQAATNLEVSVYIIKIIHDIYRIEHS